MGDEVSHIAEHFRERIKNGKLPPGGILPGIRKISRKFGVKTYSARAALDLLKDERLVKIQQGGRTTVLAEREWKRAAVLLPDTAFGHWGSIHKEIEYFLKARGWTLDLHTHHGQLELMRQHLETILNGDYAGAIFALPLALLRQDDENLAEMLETGFPLVSIGGGLNCWTVDDKLYECGYWGTSHLIEQKYKRIGLIGCRSYDGESFTEGCKRALDEAGLDDFGTGYAEDAEFTVKILENWLALEKRPDAVFYQRADHGRKCFVLLQAKRILIGSELGFMVLDDTNFHRLAIPGVSTVRRYPERIGKAAVNLFLELVNLPRKTRLEMLENPKRVDAEFAVQPGRSTSGRRMKGMVYHAMNPIPTVQQELDYYYPPSI